MDDERMLGGPALQREDLRDGLFVGRVGAEPIHGLGGKRDHLAVGEGTGRLGDVHQCAFSQLGRTPASTTSGTSSFATSIISFSTPGFTRSSSASGTSKTSSSCTCITSLVASFPA